jgi:hypothetical protein
VAWQTLTQAPPGHTRRNSWELAWEDEQQQQQQQQQHGVVSHVGSGGGGGGASMPTLLPPPPPAAAAAAAAACEVAASLQAAAVEAMLAAEAAQLPLLPIALLLAMFVAVLLTSLLSKLTKPCGSAASWAAQAAVVPVLGAIWWFVRWRLLAKVALKKAAQLDFHGEVRWTPRKVRQAQVCLLPTAVCAPNRHPTTPSLCALLHRASCFPPSARWLACWPGCLELAGLSSRRR